MQAIDIRIEYETWQGEKGVKILKPEEYFDLEEAKEIEEDIETSSIPLHEFDWHYLDVELSRLKYINLEINDGVERKISKQIFWNKGENQFFEYWFEDMEGHVTTPRQIVIQSKINDTYEIIRFWEKEKALEPMFHVFGAYDDTGKEEQYVFPEDKRKEGKINIE